jgi:uncharacterized membrane protein
MTTNANPFKKWSLLDLLVFALAAVPLVYAWIVFDRLPETMAVHFDAAGHANGFAARGTAIALLAAMNFGLALLLKIVPLLDPKGGNYAKFSRFFGLFRLVFAMFLSAVSMAMLLANAGYNVSHRPFLLGALGVLWLVLGNFMGQVRPNYTFGIRTPWTLAREDVWRKTHRMAGPLWMAGGMYAVVAAFIPGLPLGYVIWPIVGLTAAVPAVYSYWIYSKMA